jgi:hypothetical protein
MSREYRGESECEFYGITCPEDVERPGDTDSVLDVHENGCSCLDCLRTQLEDEESQ